MSRRTLYHVSASVNRDSIRAHGLDPRLMGAACGIAGSERRELDGVFVCHDRDEAVWFADMGLDHLDAVDVWEIDDPCSVLQTNTANFEYLPLPVPPERLRLLETRTESRRERLPDAEQGLAEGLSSVMQSLVEHGTVVETAAGTQIRLGPAPVAPAPPPALPPALEAEIALVLRDLDRTGAIAPGWRLVAMPQEQWFGAEDWPEDDEDDETDWIEVELVAADGAPLLHLMAMTGPDTAERQVELATAVQRRYVEHDAVDGTLHPMCVGEHPHAAVAAVRDGAAWWVCPADDSPLAPIGSYAR